MTPAVAIYLASLHNHFPAIAEAAARVERLTAEDGDVAYLGQIQRIAERHGWNILEGPLATWIHQQLKRTPTLEEWNGVNAENQRLREEVKIKVHDCCAEEKANLRAQVKDMEESLQVVMRHSR
jgi:hypothetical protein